MERLNESENPFKWLSVASKKYLQKLNKTLEVVGEKRWSDGTMERKRKLFKG
jgi:hypothetical protein